MGAALVVMSMGSRERVSLLIILAGFLMPAGAAAKGVSAAKVCGAQECVRVNDDELALALGAGGPPASGPERGLPWYRTTLTITVRDPNALAPADRERVVQHFTTAAVPRARLLRGEDGTWMTMSAESVAAYAELTAGIRPRPARTLPDVGPDAALPEARVDEVVKPPPAARPAADPADEDSSDWLAWLAGALLAATGVGWLIRRAPRRPRRDESPGRSRRATARARSS
jgi:hypothetical protein